MKLKEWYERMKNPSKYDIRDISQILHLVETGDCGDTYYVIIGDTFMTYNNDIMVDRCDIHTIIDKDTRDFSFTTEFRIIRSGSVSVKKYQFKRILTCVANRIYKDYEYFDYLEKCRYRNEQPTDMEIDTEVMEILQDKPIKFYSGLFSDGMIVGRYLNFGYGDIEVTIMPKGIFNDANSYRKYYGADTIPNPTNASIKMVFSTHVRNDIETALKDTDTVIKYLAHITQGVFSFEDDHIDKLYLDLY